MRTLITRPISEKIVCSCSSVVLNAKFPTNTSFFCCVVDEDVLADVGAAAIKDPPPYIAFIDAVGLAAPHIV